jgi:hypothetical protein
MQEFQYNLSPQKQVKELWEIKGSFLHIFAEELYL